MSRTSASNKSNGRKNPVKYRISFKGDKGVFSFNKKMDDGSWSEVTLDNLSFVLVDCLFAVSTITRTIIV